MASRPEPFQFLALGPFHRTSVRCSLTPERSSRNAETEALIESAWNDRLAMARANGQSLFPGPMCGLRGWSVDERGLAIEFGLTDYREFTGTNVAHPGIAERFGERFLANGTGVCSVLVTLDNQLILQRRSRSVFEHPGMLHVCGGSLDPTEQDGSLVADPFAVMAREFEEELGLPSPAIIEMDCLGLARDAQTLKPEVLLRTHVSLTAEHVAGATSDEHSELIVVSNDPIEVRTWIERNRSGIAPAGLACLLAHVACTDSGTGSTGSPSR